MRSLIEVLGEHVPEDTFRAYLRETGRRLARNAGLRRDADFDGALQRALDIVNSLGARAAVVTEGDVTVVTSARCPLANAVRGDVRTCNILVGFMSEATGSDVHEACHRATRLICEYRFLRRKITAAPKLEGSP